MNKLEMAHDWAMNCLKSGLTASMGDLISEAWQYADAMQAEADKREINIEETMKDHECNYIYGRVCACGKVNDDAEEWQPDWSQAPGWANWWCFSEMHGAIWFSRKPDRARDTWVILNDVKFDASLFDEAPSFCYQGNWQNSLRKRP